RWANGSSRWCRSRSAYLAKAMRLTFVSAFRPEPAGSCCGTNPVASAHARLGWAPRPGDEVFAFHRNYQPGMPNRWRLRLKQCAEIRGDSHSWLLSSKMRLILLKKGSNGKTEVVVNPSKTCT